MCGGVNEVSVDLNGQKLRRRWFVRSKGRRGHAPNHPLAVQPHRADA